MGITMTHVFHSGATDAADGTPFSPEYADGLIVEFSGAATTFDARFEELAPSGAWYPIAAINRSDVTMATAVTSKGVRWYLPVSDVRSVRVRIVSTNGALTITGDVEVSAI